MVMAVTVIRGLHFHVRKIDTRGMVFAAGGLARATATTARFLRQQDVRRLHKGTQKRQRVSLRGPGWYGKISVSPVTKDRKQDNMRLQGAAIIALRYRMLDPEEYAQNALRLLAQTRFGLTHARICPG